ncbi:hypothetical protein BHM03_00061886 [Ensete ventricosum]|nr:hypothetical protein BHM03_00061886 [Ensete ventricosum]
MGPTDSHREWQRSPGPSSIRSIYPSLKKERAGLMKSSVSRKRGPSPKTKRQPDKLRGMDHGTESSMAISIGEVSADLYSDVYIISRRTPP